MVIILDKKKKLIRLEVNIQVFDSFIVNFIKYCYLDRKGLSEGLRFSIEKK